MTRPVHLVDASLYVFRAWHSMPPEFEDHEGWPVNAVHGFARFLLDLLERERPARIAVAFDESLESNFRNALYPAYKANREPAPEELKRQFGHCQALCRALGLAVLSLAGGWVDVAVQVGVDSDAIPECHLQACAKSTKRFPQYHTLAES